MDTELFFLHWSIVDNPFRAEEARHDPVFMKLSDNRASHPDFDKIIGDLSHPSTSIVFGEKGSGKTAIRLRIEDRVELYNSKHSQSRIMVVGYDDLNPVIDRFLESHQVNIRCSEQDILNALRQFRLVDHIDAILHQAVTAVVSACIDGSADAAGTVFAPTTAKILRNQPISIRNDLLFLQALYGEDDDRGSRLQRLRKAIRAPVDPGHFLLHLVAGVGWLVPTGIFLAAMVSTAIDPATRIWQVITISLIVVWLIIFLYVYPWRSWRMRRMARRMHREIISTGRSKKSLARSFLQIPVASPVSWATSIATSDDFRYKMLDRLREVLLPVRVVGILVVIDRVDEPTFVSGAPDKMRAIVWPMFNNKFLQQNGIGIKMLLPIELRHELFRESNVFFQEARLDKQNLIERLSWTGAMLYDICTARLVACRERDAQSISLADLFEDDVTRQDIVDALDQMHQPRDAFKLLYSCIQEHCSNVTEEQGLWRIPRLVLESVRRKHSERVREFSLGYRPA